MNNKYQNEELKNKNYYRRYESGYKPIDRNTSFKVILEDLDRQAEIISNLFNIKKKFDIEWAARTAWPNLPGGVEKLFLIPKWNRVFHDYESAVNNAHSLLKKNRDVIHSLDFRFDKFTHTSKSVQVFERLADEQEDNDILVVPAQFGMWHIGESARRACELMSEKQGPLGLFALITMLLTHPERLGHNTDLCIICAGDEIVFNKNLSKSPVIGSPFSLIDFYSVKTNYFFGHYGVASAFIP